MRERSCITFGSYIYIVHIIIYTYIAYIVRVCRKRNWWSSCTIYIYILDMYVFMYMYMYVFMYMYMYIYRKRKLELVDKRLAV